MQAVTLRFLHPPPPFVLTCLCLFKMMTECEKFVSFANPEFEDDNANSFEETIPKVLNNLLQDFMKSRKKDDIHKSEANSLQI